MIDLYSAHQNLVARSDQWPSRFLSKKIHGHHHIWKGGGKAKQHRQETMQAGQFSACGENKLQNDVSLEIEPYFLQGWQEFMIFRDQLLTSRLWRQLLKPCVKVVVIKRLHIRQKNVFRRRFKRTTKHTQSRSFFNVCNNVKKSILTKTSRHLPRYQ